MEIRDKVARDFDRFPKVQRYSARSKQLTETKFWFHVNLGNSVEIEGPAKDLEM